MFFALSLSLCLCFSVFSLYLHYLVSLSLSLCSLSLPFCFSFSLYLMLGKCRACHSESAALAPKSGAGLTTTMRLSVLDFAKALRWPHEIHIGFTMRHTPLGVLSLLVVRTSSRGGHQRKPRNCPRAFWCPFKSPTKKGALLRNSPCNSRKSSADAARTCGLASGKGIRGVVKASQQSRGIDF